MYRMLSCIYKPDQHSLIILILSPSCSPTQPSFSEKKPTLARRPLGADDEVTEASLHDCRSTDPYMHMYVSPHEKEAPDHINLRRRAQRAPSNADVGG